MYGNWIIGRNGPGSHRATGGPGPFPGERVTRRGGIRLDGVTAQALHGGLVPIGMPDHSSQGAALMARKTAPAAAKTARKRPARKRSAPPKSARAPKPASGAAAMHGFGDMPKMPKMMTPEQAIDLQKPAPPPPLTTHNPARGGPPGRRGRRF